MRSARSSHNDISFTYTNSFQPPILVLKLANFRKKSKNNGSNEKKKENENENNLN